MRLEHAAEGRRLRFEIRKFECCLEKKGLGGSDSSFSEEKLYQDHVVD